MKTINANTGASHWLPESQAMRSPASFACRGCKVIPESRGSVKPKTYAGTFAHGRYDPHGLCVSGCSFNSPWLACMNARYDSWEKQSQFREVGYAMFCVIMDGICLVMSMINHGMMIFCFELASRRVAYGHVLRHMGILQSLILCSVSVMITFSEVMVS